MMEYKLPELPSPTFIDSQQACSADGTQDIVEYIHYFNEKKMRQYAEQAVAPLLAEIERLTNILKGPHQNFGTNQMGAQMGNEPFKSYVQRITTGRS